jgi:hypothetical protein
MKDKKGWLMAIVAFGVIITCALDILVYMIDPSYTITHHVQDWCGGSAESYRAAMFGFIFGSLMNHFCQWGRRD